MAYRSRAFYVAAMSPICLHARRRGIAPRDRAAKTADMMETFASLLAQRGVSTAATQRLLEHSSPRLTNDVYTNVDPVLRQAISLLPVAEWL